MASSGLVLLMLVLSSFLICSLCNPQPSDLQETRSLQKRGKKAERLTKVADYTLMIATSIKPFIAMIPVVGNVINAIIDIASKVADKKAKEKLLNFMKTEFKNLNIRIEETRRDLKWDIYATEEFGNLENNINIAWNKVLDLLEKCDESCFENLKTNEKGKEIKKDLKDTKDYVYRFHELIVGKSAYSPNYETILPNTVRCHYRRIRKFSAVNVALMFKAVTMAHFYYRLKGEETVGTLIDKAFDVSEAMFNIQLKCITNPDEYIQEDLKKFINDRHQRTAKAQEIGQYLDDTYDAFNWMVIVFITKNSDHKHLLTRRWNRHTQTGFNTVEEGEITVAMARQVKGTHTKAHQIATAIKECYTPTDKVNCKDIPETIEKCNKVENEINIKEAYTAVHAYINKEHAYVNAKDALGPRDVLNPETNHDTPYFYTGVCKGPVKSGHFTVLIKSDEELIYKNPCKNVDCGEKKSRGKCEPVENVYMGVCHCNKGYFGQNCEESLEDYKKRFSSEEIPEGFLNN